jgi:putative glycerol-1-phosphate prenyltransferase
MIHIPLVEIKKTGRKQLAVLLDPDKTNRKHIEQLSGFAEAGMIDYFFWGGSLVNEPQADYYLSLLKASTKQPVYLFPGSIYQLNAKADGLLLLSLLSGRNPDLLIGQHVQVAGRIKQMGLATTATGYLLIDGGAPTSVSYMSNTSPIPRDKPSIAACTALAGEQLGMQLIYLDAGSGAKYPVSQEVISAVRREIDLPIVVGGGICNQQAANRALSAGADVIVVGNALESNPDWLPELAAVVRAFGNLASL